jgi:outer membrane lipoprotein-sorting protein
MKKKLSLVALLLVSFTAISVAQTADEIVSKYIDAMGGKDKIATLNSVKMVASVDIGPNMKAPITMYAVNNKCVRSEVEFQGMKIISALDGDNGWNINPMSGKKEAEKMNPEQVREMKDQTDLTGSLYDYKAKGHSVDFVGKEDMEGTDILKLKVTKKNGDVEYFFLDATSYLQLKQTSKHKFGDKETESETVFSNFRKVDGIMFPFSIESREVGSSQGQAINFDSIEVNPKIDASIFKMPAPAPASATPAPAEKK